MEFNKKVIEKNTKSEPSKIAILTTVLVILMILIGLFIGAKIRKSLLEKYKIYDSAAQIENTQLFQQGLETSIGYAFVYGELKTLDPVSYPDLSGQYSYIKKVEQRYQNHPKFEKEEYKDSNGNKHTRTEKKDYWTWDTIRTDSKTATQISFLGITFPYEKIPFPASHQIDILKTGYHKRTVYYGTETTFQGTIFTVLKENNLYQTKFYENLTISETIEKLESGIELVIFGIFWSVLTGCSAFGFYYWKKNG